MLVPHFSHEWSLGGVARALEVGREAWGLSELGRKAGAPPGRGRGTQTHQSSSIQAVYLRTLCLLQHAEATHRYRRTEWRGGGAPSGATLVMKVRTVGRE